MSHLQTPILTQRAIPMAPAVLSILAVVSVLAIFFGGTATLTDWTDPAALMDIISTTGPLAVVLLLALAVIVSPIPSGPIAMAAGALYGPLVGGSLTAAGALLGAVGAFGLSRGFGYQPLSTSANAIAGWLTRPRSQMSLMLGVLVSRLIPFVSFDAISYLAGLTSLRAVNFVIATALGVLPASFAFATLGAGMTEFDSGMLLMLACGVTLILPVGWGVVRWWRQRIAT